MIDNIVYPFSVRRRRQTFWDALRGVVYFSIYYNDVPFCTIVDGNVDAIVQWLNTAYDMGVAHQKNLPFPDCCAADEAAEECALRR